jgi:hypothetical protein
MMRSFLIALFCASLATADDAPCLIVKHASTARQFFVSGANWQYVEGDFPKGMKWKSNITDRYIRKMKENGGRVVVVPQNYGAPELEQARRSCSSNAMSTQK